MFIDGSEAESALCNDRADFIKKQHITQFVPNDIKKRMVHRGSDDTYIRAFEDLFVYLEKHDAGDLHRLVIEYFYDALPLRSHLSQSLISQ